MISDAFHPPFHAVHTFCCLIAGADLIVIEKIFCTDLYRGKIRHDNVSASKDPELAPERMDRAERRRCGKQDIRILKTEKSHHKQGEFHGPCSLVSKRRVMLRDKRPDPNHFRFEIADKDHVPGETFRCLVWGADHKTAAGLVADLF